MDDFSKEVRNIAETLVFQFEPANVSVVTRVIPATFWEPSDCITSDIDVDISELPESLQSSLIEKTAEEIMDLSDEYSCTDIAKLKYLAISHKNDIQDVVFTYADDLIGAAAQELYDSAA